MQRWPKIPEDDVEVGRAVDTRQVKRPRLWWQGRQRRRVPVVVVILEGIGTGIVLLLQIADDLVDIIFIEKGCVHSGTDLGQELRLAAQ